MDIKKFKRALSIMVILMFSFLFLFAADILRGSDQYEYIILYKEGEKGGTVYYRFEKMGPVSFMVINDETTEYWPREYLIPNCLYYYISVRVGLMNIEEINGYNQYVLNASGGDCTYGVVLDRKDGTYVWASSFGSPFPDGKDIPKLVNEISVTVKGNLLNYKWNNLRNSKPVRKVKGFCRNLSGEIKIQLEKIY